ncbi:hypothetical protein [Brooklawnia cerclae]|uniref:Uncharacterized protein n=1 Tax=Brooklawnia cerclae TaxID=349934 RepID=A0ABX0SID3_9ACTN|nr:hypothetical protein [Brooklawnia cerclae]NIH58158.1 hypothetical protein [Brooklawnia cerclae]
MATTILGFVVATTRSSSTALTDDQGTSTFPTGREVEDYIFDYQGVNDDYHRANWSVADPTSSVVCAESVSGDVLCSTASPVASEKHCNWGELPDGTQTLITATNEVGWWANEGLSISCTNQPPVGTSDTSVQLPYGFMVRHGGYTFTSLPEGVYARQDETDEWFQINQVSIDLHR